MDRTVCCHGSPLALCKVCGSQTTTNVGPDDPVPYVSVECPDCRLLKTELEKLNELLFAYEQTQTPRNPVHEKLLSDLTLWKQTALTLFEFGCTTGDENYATDPDFKQRVVDAFEFVECRRSSL